MIELIKQVIGKTKENPLYFGYFCRNSGVFRRHFPIIYSLFPKRNKPKILDLGSKTQLKKLHVILRTTDAVMNINASRQLEQVGIVTKNDIIRVGGCSLFKAGAQFAEHFGKDDIHITLVTDRLSENGLAQYREAATAAGLSFDTVEAKGHGNGPTFQTQIDVALQDGDDTVALILEDDYLLDESAFTTCFRIMRDHGNVIGMNPHFHPDRERRQDIGKIVTIDGKLYCRISNTCCTFFMPVCHMRRFTKYLRVYDGWEDGAVNVAWKKELCLSPLGWTMAEHLHRTELSPANTLLGKHIDNQL